MSVFMGKDDDWGLSDPRTLDLTLVKRASYDEKKVVEAIKSTGKAKEFSAVAVQLAVNGWGTQSYGSVKISEDVLDINKFFKECGVVVPGQKVEVVDKTITPKRIVRVHRAAVARWIEESEQYSFLYTKYNKGVDVPNPHLVFPSAEHLVDEEEDADALLGVYRNLDHVHNSQFELRAKAVFDVRGVEYTEDEE